MGIRWQRQTGWDSVWAEGTQQHTWALAETGLSEPEGTGQGGCVRWSQRLGGQPVLWNTLILPEMSNKEVAKLPHMVGASQWRLTHLGVNRTESQLVEKRSTKSKVQGMCPICRRHSLSARPAHAAASLEDAGPATDTLGEQLHFSMVVGS